MTHNTKEVVIKKKKKTQQSKETNTISLMLTLNDYVGQDQN